MKVTRTDAVKMFEAMGIKTASKWNDARLSGKLAKVNTMVDEDTELADPASKKLLDAVLAANEAEEEIELAEAGEKTSMKKGKKKAAEAETTDAPVEKKKGKKKAAEAKTTEKPAKAAKNGKPKSDKAEVEYENLAGVRSVKNRRFVAGVMLREHGLEAGVTEELVKLVNDAYGFDNIKATRSQLTDAWHVVNGYLNG